MTKQIFFAFKQKLCHFSFPQYLVEFCKTLSLKWTSFLLSQGHWSQRHTNYLPFTLFEENLKLKTGTVFSSQSVHQNSSNLNGHSSVSHKKNRYFSSRNTVNTKLQKSIRQIYSQNYTPTNVFLLSHLFLEVIIKYKERLVFIDYHFWV